MLTMGDNAAGRMESVAQAMGEQARAVDTSTKALHDSVSEAQNNVSIILSSLPKANEEMRDMAARLDAAGLSASQRAASLDVQLTALGERGREADAIAGGAPQRHAAHI
jgi:hypothetical protein